MKRISLSNTAFEGNNNVYLFDEGSKTVLVDTGDHSEETKQQLLAALATHDLGFADIDQIILTHWHHDHVGLAGYIQQASGAPIHVHEADAALVRRDKPTWMKLWEDMEAYYDEWGIPQEKQDALGEAIIRERAFDTPLEVRGFADGDQFTINDTTLRAVHVSGHAEGLCVFEIHDETDSREILSSDALLPEYTPNVGGADLRVDRPLQRYLEALQHIIDAGYTKAWPGHRDPIDDPAGRAQYIIHHHEQRAWRVLDALQRLGPSDVWTVSADLFGTLDGIHILHGPGEAYAHLTHLVEAGDVLHEESVYRISPETLHTLEQRDSTSWNLSR